MIRTTGRQYLIFSYKNHARIYDQFIEPDQQWYEQAFPLTESNALSLSHPPKKNINAERLLGSDYFEGCG
jgi:uridine kinase